MGRVTIATEKWKSLVEKYNGGSDEVKETMDFIFEKFEIEEKWEDKKSHYSGYWIVFYKLKRRGKTLRCLVKKDMLKTRKYETLRDKNNLIMCSPLLEIDDLNYFKSSDIESIMYYNRNIAKDTAELIMETNLEDLEVINFE